MDEFERYLAEFDRRALWTSREWSEPLGAVYLTLRVCLRDGCDALTAQPGGFILHRDGHEVERFPNPRVVPQPDFRELLRLVCQRDARVRERLRLADESADGPVYRLTPPGAPSPDRT